MGQNHLDPNMPLVDVRIAKGRPISDPRRQALCSFESGAIDGTPAPERSAQCGPSMRR